MSRKELNQLEIEARAIMDDEYPVTGAFWQRIKAGGTDGKVRCFIHVIQARPHGYTMISPGRERVFGTLRDAIMYASRFVPLKESALRSALDNLICLPRDKLIFLQSQFALLIPIFPQKIWQRVLHVMQIMVFVRGLPQPIAEEMLQHVLP